ncbi:hypothetical protein IMX26_06805 [Clostridium sp. 'deep sea']|uniref:hypothetical protein n=1 Tax=Clostridium sp. 'deep sea' TaxID=2779445 RepID=UPI0018964E85|nr:hypothetical protein [Clostridium sp. 'deep sea']QOR36513.1 hypothetical protein IMX26_06805 [Clostridium sp. 'deep sea']
MIAIAANVASAYQSYSGSIKYVHSNYYYLLATQTYSNPIKARNVVSSYAGNHNANWKVRGYYNGNKFDVTQSYWHKTGDYTYNYEDYGYSLDKEQLLARANSNEGTSYKYVAGKFWGKK